MRQVPIIRTRNIVLLFDCFSWSDIGSVEGAKEPRWPFVLECVEFEPVDILRTI
jgi:hypothetical protein